MPGQPEWRVLVCMALMYGRPGRTRAASATGSGTALALAAYL